MGIKILDKVYVKESDMPMTLRLHQLGEPLIEFSIFIAVFAYLVAIYTVMRGKFGSPDPSSKVKGT